MGLKLGVSGAVGTASTAVRSEGEDETSRKRCVVREDRGRVNFVLVFGGLGSLVIPEDPRPPYRPRNGGLGSLVIMVQVR